MPTKTIKYLNFTPHLGRKVKADRTAIIIGNTLVSDCTTLRKNVIIRGDGKSIKIGKSSPKSSSKKDTIKKEAKPKTEKSPN